MRWGGVIIPVLRVSGFGYREALTAQQNLGLFHISAWIPNTGESEEFLVIWEYRVSIPVPVNEASYPHPQEEKSDEKAGLFFSIYV